MVGLNPSQATLPSKRGSPALLGTLCHCYLEWDHIESQTSSLTWLKFNVLVGQVSLVGELMQFTM